MIDAGLSAQRPAYGGGEKIGFQFDGSKARGTVGQMSDRCITRRSVGQSNDRRRVQVTIRRQKLRLDDDLHRKPPFVYVDDLQAKPARQVVAGAPI